LRSTTFLLSLFFGQVHGSPIPESQSAPDILECWSEASPPMISLVSPCTSVEGSFLVVFPRHFLCHIYSGGGGVILSFPPYLSMSPPSRRSPGQRFGSSFEPSLPPRREDHPQLPPVSQSPLHTCPAPLVTGPWMDRIPSCF